LIKDRKAKQLGTLDAAELDLIVPSTSGGCRWRHLDHIWNEEELEDFSLSLSLLSFVAKGVCRS
jgi:hypothetical protein